MTRADLLDVLLHLLIFLLGAGIGSFLNVVIYRVPLGLSVNNPRRSFCFSCKQPIPWYRNLPLITWVVQRGKCANCGARIAFRYFFVELLTGCLFYAIFLRYGTPLQAIAVWGPMVLCYWIFTALLVAGTFIDLDHYILPFEITVSGVVVGLLGSFWVPDLMKEATHSRGLLISFLSAGIAFGGLWMVVELGKLAFGRLRHRYDKSTSWTITQPDENQLPILTVGEEKLPFEEIYGRDSDRLMIKSESVTVNEHTFGPCTVEVKLQTVRVLPKEGEQVSFKFENVDKLEGMTTEIVVPREAMGFGDTVLLAMIGAFLGWKAVLFTLLAASAIGSLFGLVPRLFGKTEWAAKIPFGPYLSAGALIWLFWGAQILEWYMVRTGWREAGF